MDFTLKAYHGLLLALKERDYAFLPFVNFARYGEELLSLESSRLLSFYNELMKKPLNSTVHFLVVIRHNVDRNPENALKLAELESKLRIYGTYYFRIVDESFNSDIIKKIADMGHEIGYHYEDVELSIKNSKLKIKKLNEDELIEKAYESFCSNLEKLRKLADIKTIYMHRPSSQKYDNRIIWQKYDYRALGIVAAAYFDIDWNEFAYFTDFGRRWDGRSLNLKDRLEGKQPNAVIGKHGFMFNLKSTKDIINNVGMLQDKIMFTVHPELWNDSFLPWIKGFIYYNIRNRFTRIIHPKDLYIEPDNNQRKSA
jgi:hypothetical protein